MEMMKTHNMAPGGGFWFRLSRTVPRTVPILLDTVE